MDESNEPEAMKTSRELKNYITRYRDHLKKCYWDDLMIIIKMQTCKKNKKPRVKNEPMRSMQEDL